MATRELNTTRKTTTKTVSRLRGTKGLKRRYFVVDVALLERLMRRTGKNQSEVLSEALTAMLTSSDGD